MKYNRLITFHFFGFKYCVKELWIWDDNFTYNKNRVEEICKGILREQLKFYWQCPNGIRADKIDFNLLKLMKLAGCWSVALAPETGDLKNLKKINKDLTLERVEYAAELCRKIDMFFRVFMILGFPFDTPQSVQNNENYIKKINPHLLTRL